MTITENTTSPVGVIEYLNPNTLIIEENVRPSADLNREFVQSIRANGVLTPVRARRDAEGRVLVRAGQRRTLAAREVGLAMIAVHIIDGDEATAERIVQQLVENDQRLALTDADRTVAFKQLEFAGLTPAAISKRTGTKTATVKTTLQVANTPAAADAMTAHQLTLDQAAELVELDDDEETRAALIKTAVTVPAQFEHELQRARDERARREALQAAITDHESRG
ncbi:ParB/RepB/Spo0J family partition protein [Clavibacter michiganensis]|uniref:ParB/RepB/Spo0J family partition protein n=1 Tax=Clavibacter michiganensis TaxID=28447 RepID=UPI00345C7752